MDRRKVFAQRWRDRRRFDRLRVERFRPRSASGRRTEDAPVRQRWVLDNIIQTNGIDWHQPRTAGLIRACGLDVVNDMNALRQRVKKFADIAPAFATLARRREQLAEDAEAAAATIPAGDNYFIAARYWASAMWPIHEVNDTLKQYQAI
ncbi:MAG TPA: hypothetical protein VGJ20_10620 [Xanthobacteraceae bacterium]|jgi:hypothetical protein